MWELIYYDLIALTGSKATQMIDMYKHNLTENKYLRWYLFINIKMTTY